MSDPLFVRIIIVFLLLSVLSAAGIAAEEPLIINTSYSPPYSTPDEDGILDLITKEAFAPLGIAVSIRMLPAERALVDANIGVSDGDMGRVEGMEQMYPDLVIVHEPIIESRDFVAFSLHHRFTTEDWASLAPYHVGIVKGWKIFEANIPETRSLIKAESTETLFRLLKNNRIDVALNARLDGMVAATELGMSDVGIMEPPLARMKLYLYLHTKHDGLVPKVEANLAQMKADGRFYRIYDAVMERLMPGS